jgi:hypothetical protein
MKNLTILLAIVLGSNLYGQTDSIEKAIIYNKFLSKEISLEAYTKIGAKWNEIKKKIGIYPKLPLNKEGKIQYSFLRNFTNTGKEKLYNRTLEWISIQYGIIPSNLYSNLEDGKIISTNRINISNTTSCIYTHVITIKDGKVLIEYTNIGYQVTIEGYYSGENWIPEKANYYNIDHVFPIILKEIADWKDLFGLIKMMDERFNNDVISLCDYINSYESKYVF